MATELDTLPLSVLASIAKGGIPENMAISKEAKAALQRAAGVFILYLNSAANDVCKSSKRSTVSGPDILKALEEIDMGELVKPCKEALEAMKASEARKRAARPPAPKRQKVSEAPGAPSAEAAEADAADGGAEAPVNDAMEAEGGAEEEAGRAGEQEDAPAVAAEKS